MQDMYLALRGSMSSTGAALASLAIRDREALREKWEDEAREATLAGNPRRAWYIESVVIPRVLG